MSWKVFRNQLLSSVLALLVDVGGKGGHRQCSGVKVQTGTTHWTKHFQAAVSDLRKALKSGLEQETMSTQDALYLIAYGRTYVGTYIAV